MALCTRAAIGISRQRFVGLLAAFAARPGNVLLHVRIWISFTLSLSTLIATKAVVCFLGFPRYLFVSVWFSPRDVKFANPHAL